MSQWTHVSAIIRIDAIRGMMPEPQIPSPPAGSEGPLSTSFWVNPAATHLAAYTLTAWGDLRDYDDEQEIINWLTSITQGRMIRAGVAQIDIEYQRRTTWEHRCDLDEPHYGKWVMVACTETANAQETNIG